MVQNIIELAYDTDSNGEIMIAGNPDDTLFDSVEQHLTAIQHNMNNGAASTLYRVDDNADATNVTTLTDSHEWHFNWGVNNGIIRGIEIQPGTPTDSMADQLVEDITNAGGPDLTVDQPSYEPSVHIYNDLPSDALDVSEPSWSSSTDQGAGGGPVTSNTDPSKSVVQVIKEDFPDIGSGNWRCVHPDHTSPEINPVTNQCSLEHSDELVQNEYAQQHRDTFDPTGFL